jgi:RNA polymerase sigma factor (sigma-70 family)
MTDCKTIEKCSLEVQHIWHTRHQELEPEVFDRFPRWMDLEPAQEDDQKDLNSLVASTLATLTPREEKILYLRYWHGLTRDKVGKIFELTSERIRQIETRSLRKMRHRSRSEALRPFA